MWISVDKALPSDERPVIMCYKTVVPKLYKVGLGCYLDGDWWNDDCNSFKVLYWQDFPVMPLIEEDD